MKGIDRSLSLQRYRKLRTVFSHLDVMMNALCELLSFFDIAIDIVDDCFDCRHLIVDKAREFLGCRYVGIYAVRDLQISRYRHEILFFCERIQSCKRIFHIRPPN